MLYLAELYLAASAPLPVLDVPGLRNVIHVPEDEICLLVLDSPDEAAARTALRGAGVDVARLQRASARDVEALGARR